MANSPPDFEALAVPGVRGLKPYEPGKPIDEVKREYGLTNIIKLASNESPLGQSPKVASVIESHSRQLATYPDGNAHDLKQALAGHWGVPTDCITLGNGSDEIVNMLAEVLLDAGRNAVVSRHSFAAYGIATHTVSAELRVADANPADAPMPYGHNLNAMRALVDDATRLVFIANPNNPTGTWITRDDLTAFVDAIPPETVVVLDEAYFEYVEEGAFPSGAKLLAQYPNLVVLHTFSKVYGLAGLRVGYSLSHPRLAELLNRIRPPFNVNALAQAAAQTSLADHAHIKKAIRMNREGRLFLERGLRERQLKFIPSVGNFITIRTGGSGRAVFEALLQKGVIVRALDSYELPEYIRVSIGSPGDNQRFLTALEEVL